MTLLGRRVFVSSAALAAGIILSRTGNALTRTDQLRLGEALPFRFEELVRRARVLAERPYRAPQPPAPEVVEKIDYDVHGKIHFKTARALFGAPGPYPATFFHLGRYFPNPVRMHEVRDGKAREILYSPDDFAMPASSIARALPRNAGFAGFRLHESTRRSDWKTQDWLAFLGASYFRSIGALGQYGLSARGLTVNTTAPGLAEEFPSFTEFYLESAASESDPVVIHALLDGPSIAGAYRFACARESGVVMDVECQLFVRSDIAQLGVAPLTSMFWYAEYDRGYRVDWRPEVHDSDGLAIWNGSGERIYRPLNNPSRTITSSFLDEDPRGFGLLQRDRAFDHYLDGVNYDRRPSVWVEPLGQWGKGAIQLVEIQTDDEIHDNVVAFWSPAEPARAGSAHAFRYRLHWLADEPYRPEHIAQVVATRIGRGGQPGKPRPEQVTKFVIEFAGDVLEGLRHGRGPRAEISASRGQISYVFTEPIPSTRRWRAHFDLTVGGDEPVELRLYLKEGNRALSETWMHQFEPRQSKPRTP